MGTLVWIVAGSLFGGLVSLGLAAVAWRHRGEPAAVPFGWLMVALGGWGLSQAALLSTTDPSQAYLLERIASISSAQVPPLLLVFVLAYTGRQRWLRARYLAALWAMPIAYTLASLTGPLHGLTALPADVAVVTAGGITAPDVRPGPLNDVQLIYAYSVLAITYAILLQFAITSRAAHRRQAGTIALATSVGLVADVATRIGLPLHPEVVLTPVSIPVAGVAIGWALFRYDFLRVSPLDGDILVDQLPDPVFVVDDADRVVDHNRAARERFGDDLTGDRLSAIVPGILDAVEGNATYSAEADDEITYYDPQMTTVDDQHGTPRGRLVVLRDVTGQQRRQDRLEALQAATREFITAQTATGIAELTVSFADRVLDQDAAAVYLAVDDGAALRPAAVSESVEREVADEELQITDPSNPVFRAYREESTTSELLDDPAFDTPFPQMLAVPIEGHGALTIGRREAETFASEDRQFAEILARTTQVALTQIDRERELRESRAAVERRSDQIEFFNGVLRHTLRNALLVIRGRADHLREHVEGRSERHLDRIAQWCEDLDELSEKIRAINDTVTATEAERLDSVDLTELLRDCAGTAAEHESVIVEYDVEEGLEVLANALADEVIESVVRNAIRHNDASEPRVEITAYRASGRVHVEVADNGPGMPDEMKETVFERDIATSHTAHGFGLYFVSVMMNLYGGTVWFKDNDPRGAVAVLEFRSAERSEAKGTSEPA